jgi:hypothetical protein
MCDGSDRDRSLRTACEGTPCELQELHARRHTHASPTMVDVVTSGEPVRASVTVVLRRYFSLVEPKQSVPVG